MPTAVKTESPAPEKHCYVKPGKAYIPVRGLLLQWILLICLPFASLAQDSLPVNLKGKPLNFDIHLLDQLNPDTPSSKFMSQISNSAYWLPASITLAELGYGFIADDPLNKRYAVETGVTVGIGQAMSIGLKHLFKRPRPFMSYPDIIHPINYGTGPSFPSGHTTLAFSTAASLALTRKQWTVTLPITLWAGSVGYSRMYLGRHYPTDVLGGLAVGIVSGILGHWVTGRIYGD
ncbi:PAP2 superfamily protein [Arachidicoccus rhizosphaerae]|jgi:membrane-associated phospholipid phosphatase|uniref:PAP2 superfamily protein n=1 Tax=Arachidicoccus rhizosphaerae TaxID=551991 RepID=A0A1H3WWF4_9BACT|nr:phosphatase PAP2 family protein [Arachidicoccus rhizosphaerae]SDZ91473.1 PAP2 superfamily protein [Arachidicoccus rhizosphaerae]